MSNREDRMTANQRAALATAAAFAAALATLSIALHWLDGARRQLAHAGK